MKKLLVIVLALVLALGCTSALAENVKLRVGATPAPHAEILDFVAPILAEQGIDLEVAKNPSYVLHK